jgi:16S rRNA (adenine1518-N6/adenine1519-N6)-dimethyltransferase
MVQKEVADRLSAAPGGKDYGVLTASLRYYTQPKTLFTVSKNCFYPSPDVDSAIVRMEISAPPLPVSREMYVKVVRAAFAARRKTIYNNLAAAFGINPSLRAEALSPADFLHLAEFFLKNKK